MNIEDIKWGNIQLPNLSDEQLYSKQYRDIKSEESKRKTSEKLKGVPKSKEHKKALEGKRVNPGMMGKSKSEEKIKACKENAVLGGKTGAGAKATKQKYSKPIICYYYPSLKYRRTFSGIKEAGRILQINAGNISNVLNNRAPSTKGYYFEYKNKS